MLHLQRRLQHQRRPVALASAAALCRAYARSASTRAAAAASSAAAVPARASSKPAAPPRRQTWLREQTQLDEQRRAEDAAAAAAASASSPPASAAASDVDDPAPSAAATAAAAQLPSLSLSHLLLRPPAQSAAPLSRSDPMSLLDRAGIVRRMDSTCMLLPAGVRALSKLERTLSDELAATFQPQEIAALHSQAAAELASASAATASAACYPTSFASQLPLFTQLLAPEFRAEGRSAYHSPLVRATLSTAVWHPAATAATGSSSKSKTLASARSSSSALWSASKSTRDLVQLSSGSRAAAMERYHALLDCYVRTINQLGETQALVVETTPSSRGAQGVDADLAHELHVPAFNPAASGGGGVQSVRAPPLSSSSSLLKCNQCDYVAKMDRAVSKCDATLTPSSSASSSELGDVTPSPQNLPAALQSFFRDWIVRQLGSTFPASVVQRLNLQSASSRWKCELLVDRATLLHTSAAADQADAAALPIVYLVLLREGDELNVSAVSEHVASQGLLRRIDDAALTYEVLRRTLAADEIASLPSLGAASSSRGPSARFRSNVRFDPRPELLIDAALIPEGLDLDMEAIAAAQLEEAQAAAERAQEEEEARTREAERIEAAAAASAAEIASSTAADPDSSASAVPVTAAHAKFERQLSSAARSLAPGQSLDLLQMDLASQGVDPAQARAQLVEEARELQRQAHEERLAQSQAQSNAEMMRLMEAAEAGEDPENDDEGATDEMEDPAEPSVASSGDSAASVNAASSSAASLPASSSSLASSSLRHFEYSPQGFFRLAQAGERCAMHRCKTGRLTAVHTHVVANAAFVGRQELVDDADVDEAGAKRRKKQYLHSIYGRFSSYDLLAHLLLKSLKLPSATTAVPSASASPSSGLTLDSLTLLHYPGLLAPIQLALVPVLSSAADSVAGSNLRDFHRNLNQARAKSKGDMEQADAQVWQACRDLHQSVAALSLTPPTLEQASLGLGSFPSASSALDGDLVIDDRTSLALNVRVQSLVSLGVPVIVLIQPRALLASDQVSLVLNRAGVALAPRRVPLQGLANLLHKMMRANYAPMLQSKRVQQQEKQKQEEQRRKKEEEAAKTDAERVQTKSRRS